MKKHILFLLCLIAVASTRAQVFADHFADKTLRVDYIFNGNASGQAICLDGLSALPTWAGRKHHLAELPLQGNGQIVMRECSQRKDYLYYLFLLTLPGMAGNGRSPECN